MTVIISLDNRYGLFAYSSGQNIFLLITFGRVVEYESNVSPDPNILFLTKSNRGKNITEKVPIAFCIHFAEFTGIYIHLCLGVFECFQ